MEAEDVKKLRGLLGLTQEELAQKIGVTRNTIINYEKGGVIPDSKGQLISSLFELAAVNVDVDKIDIDEQGNTIAFDKKGAKYTGVATPIGGERLNTEEFLSALYRKDKQIDKMLALLESQQHTIEVLAGKVGTADAV